MGRYSFGYPSFGRECRGEKSFALRRTARRGVSAAQQITGCGTCATAVLKGLDTVDQDVPVALGLLDASPFARRQVVGDSDRLQVVQIVDHDVRCLRPAEVFRNLTRRSKMSLPHFRIPRNCARNMPRASVCRQGENRDWRNRIQGKG